MAITKLTIDEFLNIPASVPVLDVRSPSEFAHAHIPSAIAFPIFTDEERKIIGTAYKQQSREIAIKIGLDAFGKKMSGMVTQIENYFIENKIQTKEVRVHCWRGGMRSAAIAWLLDLYGFKVYLLQGGYKTYRQWALSQFEKKYNILVIGGFTGGNKTGILNLLEQKGEAVLDLEKLAGHMGSAFGNLENFPQPSQEHFENQLAKRIFELSNHSKKIIWIEGESQRIGNVNIPLSFFKNMRVAPLLFMDIPFEKRLSHIVNNYGKFSKEKLINATMRIKKRLGGLETKNVINALLEDDVTEAFRILLAYYDKYYLKSTNNKEEGERELIKIESDTTDAKINAEKVLKYGSERQQGTFN